MMTNEEITVMQRTANRPSFWAFLDDDTIALLKSKMDDYQISIRKAELETQQKAIADELASINSKQ